MRLAPLLLAALIALSAGPAVQAADDPFAARLIINDRPVTNFEVEQRIAFLRALNAPGDLEKTALSDLTDDRLRLDAAKAEKIKITDEQLTVGMTEFAGRANLPLEEFTKALEQRGVEKETFRDFVRAGMAWREVVRAKFAARAFVSDGEVSRAFDSTLQRGGVRVLLSELVLPAQPGQEADAQAQAEELRATIGSAEEFAAAAAQYSAAGSARQGGRIDWIDLGNLPPALRDVVLTLKPGEVSAPVQIQNAVALFLLRGLEETGAPSKQAVTLDYMTVLLAEGAGTAAEVARLKAGSDRCDDLYGLTKGRPEGQVTRQKQAAAEVPRDVALALAQLDPGESSASVQRGGARLFLMLCGRDTVPGGDTPPTTAQIRDRLANQKLALLAEGYLQDLRAAAVIREP